MSEVETATIIKSEFTKLLRDDFDGDIENIPLAELGIDSLDFYEKLIFLEDEYGIEIPISELNSQVTLGAILSAQNGEMDQPG